MSDFEILACQLWESDDKTIQLWGNDLADRLWARRLYFSLEKTRDVLLSTAVGECVVTGVSLWQRIR